MNTSEFNIQIDVIELKEGYARCNLYTGSRCISLFMPEGDYKALIRDGFFIRTGDERDSAGVLNTTTTFVCPGS